VLALSLLDASTCSHLPSSSAPPSPSPGAELHLPNREGALRFAVIGDSGTGDPQQYQVASEMAAYHGLFPFELVVMVGDNIYGSDSPDDYKRKFERPYQPLLDAGVKFYACLGNHDNTNERFYKPFNMGGQRFYTFQPKKGVRFFALDSNYLDKEELDWLDRELSNSGSDWKIAFFHHPLYSSGMFHGPSVDKRQVLEPILYKYSVNLVLSGHEHFYERIKPQNGIYYFISGGAGKLRVHNIRKTDLTEKGFDTDHHFVMFEIDQDDVYFQAISRTGVTVDSGVIHRSAAAQKAERGDAARPPSRGDAPNGSRSAPPH
jgi:hypothetical protein